jgi:hypothetical protein
VAARGLVTIRDDREVGFILDRSDVGTYTSTANEAREWQ